MHCSACGTRTPDDAAFCPKCGKALSTAGGGKSAPSAADRLFPTDSSPSEAEKDLWQGHYSWKGMIGHWVAAFFATVVLLVAAYFIAAQGWTSAATIWGVAVGIAALVWIWNGVLLLYRQMSISYRLTSELFILQRGILFVTFDRLELIDIDDITVEQGIVDRMLNVGTLTILSSDTSDPKVDLIGVDDVQVVAEILDKARRKRRERAVKMEAI